jgi:hypothetical protein
MDDECRIATAEESGNYETNKPDAGDSLSLRRDYAISHVRDGVGFEF